MTYAVIALSVVCLSLVWVIRSITESARIERTELLTDQAYERTLMTDRLMAALSDEDNPLAASVQATSLRVLGGPDRPVHDGGVSYVDDEREYELQRSGNGDDEEA